jgi:DNA-binding transcriptional regulator YiaG
MKDKMAFLASQGSAKMPCRELHKKYPENPNTFGEHLQKASIDAGLLIKDLAAKIGVTEDTVINWEVRGRMPRGKAQKKLKLLFANSPDLCIYM